MTSHGFRLGQVLEHKRRLEEQRQLELQQLLAERERRSAECAELQARLDAQIADISDHAGTGSVDAAELEAASQYVTLLQALVEQHRALVRRCDDGVAACREALTLALQERRALELLQERQDNAARIEANRREDRAVDDINSARFSMGQNG